MSTKLLMPTDRLYLQSWVRIFVEVSADGPAFDDLVYRVEPAHTGCTISYCRDGTFDPDYPHFILAAGGMVGEHKVYAIDKNTGDFVAEGAFSVSDSWTGSDGPPLCVTGDIGEANATFGGGVVGKPQNYEVHPRKGEWRVAVVILETSDVTPMSTADASTLRTTLAGQLFDGVPGTNGESAAAYFREVSHDRFTIENFGVIGPIRLSNTFMGYGPDVSDADEGTYDGLTQFSRAGMAAIRQQNMDQAALGQPPVLDLTTVDSILFAIRSVPPPPPPPPPADPLPGASQWPSATRPNGGRRLSFQVATKPITVSFPWGDYELGWPDERLIECIAMPVEWESLPSSSAKAFQDVATHELGHNLGLPDEYSRPKHSAEIAKRDLNNWTLMSDETDLPHLSTPEKLRLGWTRDTWVKQLNFAVMGPIDEEITLTAAELGKPDTNTFAAVELRRGDGSNYYFEYRQKQLDQVGDQSLPEKRRGARE